MHAKRILVVEDEYFLADDCASLIREAGFDIVGPVASVEDTLELISRGAVFDGALLDVNLQGSMVFPLLDILVERGVPLAIYTGYPELPERYSTLALFLKPDQARLAVNYLSQRVGSASPLTGRPG
jgi:DNA-binding NtrC family response regulator